MIWCPYEKGIRVRSSLKYEEQAQPAHAADLAFGLVFSFVCSSVFRYILEPSPAQPAKRLMRKPLGGIMYYMRNYEKG
jgi:hypothetical protein